uniref:Repulsive guidance molecule BMP co-receptor a n=2 Tax=Eptatretus burgeri TaxID=7764 RepID=A0A8C4NGS9_EPTBU
MKLGGQVGLEHRTKSEMRATVAMALWLPLSSRSLRLTLLTVGCLSVFLSFPQKALSRSECRILKCNSVFDMTWSAAQTPAGLCAALRSYSRCTKAMAKMCRGDLAYHAARRGIDDLMAQHNCSKDGPSAPSPTSDERIEEHMGREDPARGRCSFSPAGLEGVYNDGEVGPEKGRVAFSYCGLFGDPHLRTFHDDFQTCKVEGAWPLVDNGRLFVQVTNIPVVPLSSATASNKLTIIFKSFGECTEQKMYQAESGSLPPAFVDGSKNGGPRDSTGSLRVLELVPGHHIEIRARHIGTTVVVRQVGRYLTFAVRVPSVLAEAGSSEAGGLQLCLSGCPALERIHKEEYHALLARPPARAPAPATARARCKERLPVEDLYFHSCVFDLLTTGDLNFTQAAYAAFEDVRALYPDKRHLNVYRSTTDPTLRGGAPGRPWRLAFSLIAAAVSSAAFLC